MNKRSGSSLFLMEMLMVVMFFILCASTCILVFVKSNNLSRLAKDTNQSVIISESLAEIFKAGDMDDYLGMEAMNSVEETEGTYVVSYNHSWQPVSGAGEYKAVVAVTADNGMEKAEVSVTRASDNRLLYQLEVSRYIG